MCLEDRKHKLCASQGLGALDLSYSRVVPSLTLDRELQGVFLQQSHHLQAQEGYLIIFCLFDCDTV